MQKTHLDILELAVSKKTLDSNKLSHKGYNGSVEVSFEDNCLHGRVLFIDDIVTYEGESPEELEASFKEAVDRYITYCKEAGKPANKPYSGTFNVRVGEELHRKAVQAAYNQNITLNDYVAQAIKFATEQNHIKKVEHTHHHNITVNIGSAIEKTLVATTQEPLWGSYHATTH
jgi:predicted HicB family RNase H-like nuclease